jgi:hypothetical protein
MKTRLGIFIAALLLLPLAGLFISGSVWDDLPLSAISDYGDATIVNPPAILLTTLLAFGYLLLVNHIIKLLSGTSPLNLQRNYFLAMAGAGSVLVWLLTYLNSFVASWTTQTDNPLMQFLLYTPLFALLVPAVLGTRAMLGAFPGLLKRLARARHFTAIGTEKLALILTALAASGLLGGAAWPAQLFWLLWAAPLLLLTALQLLWHESTVFSGLKSGDWGRVLCSALAGVIVGNFFIAAYHMNGGLLAINLPNPLFEQLGFAAFGLLCLQLGDVVAEHWRGKQRTEQFKKKKFPIPVVSRKN